MIYLTDSAIKYAANICTELDGYKVVIACDRVKINRDFKKLLSIIKGDDVSKVYRDSLCFKNGSSIRFVPVLDCSRGNRAHLLIVDPEIDKEFLHSVLLPMETLNWYKYNNKA